MNSCQKLSLQDKRMILRIVKMEFKKDSIDDFDALFQHYGSWIRATPGCLSLELHRDPGNPLIRYTHSTWDDPESLDAYRHGELFSVVWPETKALFGGRPQAFSLEKILEVAPLQ